MKKEVEKRGAAFTELCSDKKAQITIFMILGVAILVLGSIMIYMYSSSSENAIDIEGRIGVPLEAPAMTEYIESCLEEQSIQPIMQITAKGGIFNPQNIRWYNDQQYTFHCLFDSTFNCVNQIISREYVEQQLNQEIEERIAGCFNFTFYQDLGYEIQEGEKKINTVIKADDIDVFLNYPLRFSKDDFALELDDFSTTLQIGLSEFLDLSIVIINSEIQNGSFDQDQWMIDHGSEIMIEKHKPYPDIVYSLKRWNKKYRRDISFNFALKGYDSVYLMDSPKPEFSFKGYCKTKRDNNCYANADQVNCEGRGGNYSLNKPDNCILYSQFSDPLCGNRPCLDCADRIHGESWCDYEAPAGKGYDYVGSRHYKKTCIDGTILTEECRDFRDELCTQDLDLKKAVCRTNRWQDCVAQTDEDSCENTGLRDCKWTSELVNESIPSYGLLRTDVRCHPYVPPGFRFWEEQGMKRCNFANELRYCDEFMCPQIWVDTAARFCTFMGDCGKYRNINNNLTIEGNILPQGEPNKVVTMPENMIDRGWLFSIELPLNKTMQQDYTGLEYEYREGEADYMIGEMIRFLDEALSWNICDICGCHNILGIKIPKMPCNFNKRTPSLSFCKPWQPPPGGDYCSACTEFDKPCTEYRCMSLGRTCMYYEINGTGNCSDSNPGDIYGPILTVNTTSEGTTSIPQSILVGTGAYVCNGDSCDDDEVGSDGLQPYSRFNISIDTNEEARCFITMSPVPDVPLPPIGNIFDPSEQADFSRHHTFSLAVPSIGSIRLVLKQFIEFSTFFELSTVDLIDQKATAIKDKINGLIDGYDFVPGIDWDGYKDMVDQAYDEYMGTARPLVINFISEYSPLVIEFITEIERSNFLVFVQCVDTSGNSNEDTFFIKYRVAEDTTPAVVLESEPVNETRALASPFNWTIQLNEPAECRYAEDDRTYEEMSYKMECSAPLIPLPGITYSCSKKLALTSGRNELYVRCKDQPETILDMEIHLLESLTNFSLKNSSAPQLITIVPPDVINVTNAYVLLENDTEVLVNIPNPLLSIKVEQEVLCKIGLDKEIDYDQLIESMDCLIINGTTTCSHYLQGIGYGDMDYYMKCRRFDAPQRNINQDSTLFKFWVS